MSGYTAIVAGATGLVGQHVVRFLSEDDDFETVYVLNRRNVAYTHPKIQQIITDFDNVQESVAELKPTHAFCCLGTTIKQAGSKEAFRKVDEEYVLNFARAVYESGCRNFNVITALGTNSSSMIFYNQVKYEVTIALEKIGFDQLNILQPSLLLGDRGDNRMGENIAQKFFNITKKLWIGPLKNVAGIQGEQVAKAMVAISKNTGRGIFKIASGDLQDY